LGGAVIRNPILPGFNPDPSICRVGEDYYIATSTFEWYPGVQIHHSRDLINWRLVRRPLERATQLDMRGNPDSCGVWAPCLSYADDKFWLVYTDVKRFEGNFKDAHNYIVTADSVEGRWSDPIYVNSSGFDPSLFHDDDGRKWFLNMLWDHRDPAPEARRHPAFAGIVAQEWDPNTCRLIGNSRLIFKGGQHGLVEGPHLFKRDRWYYLITAEGGTGYEHAVTLARSRFLEGPYWLHPRQHVVTAKDEPASPLQRAGHGQVVETPAGPYLVHLCSRPLPGLRRSPLGRETAIQRCEWRDDGWLYLAQGGVAPAMEVDGVPGVQSPDRHSGTEFSQASLPSEFQWLRTPYPERIFSLSAAPGKLRLIGRESIGSWFEQALVARRQQDFAFSAETQVEFSPTTFQQAAGIVLYYNRYKFHALALTADETGQHVLTVLSCPGDYPEGRLVFPMAPMPLKVAGPVPLRLQVIGAELTFSYFTQDAWVECRPRLDASLISDEAGGGEHRSFTGAFVGMFAFDVSGSAACADFTFLKYRAQQGAADR
jgi:xylan 1,4-beta-xylosidase